MAGRANDACATREEVESWFDGDGRLIKEAEMRKTLFEGEILYDCTESSLISWHSWCRTDLSSKAVEVSIWRLPVSLHPSVSCCST